MYIIVLNMLLQNRTINNYQPESELLIYRYCWNVLFVHDPCVQNVIIALYPI